MRARVAALTLLPALLVLQGCGGSESDLEKSLRNSINEQSTADVQFVACPKNVKTGQTFKCKAVVPVDVTQLDDNGNLRWQITNLSGKPPGATGVSGPTLGTSGLTGATGATAPTGPSFPVGASGTSSPAGDEGIRLVQFRNRAAGYSILQVSGWRKAGTGDSVTFSALTNARSVTINKGKSGKPTPAGLEKEVSATPNLVNKSKAKVERVGGQSAVTITYTQRQSNGAKTFVRRYIYWRSGSRVSLYISSPANTAQVPNYVKRMKRIANSFRWR
jgi:hypothetical protein